MEFTHEPFRFNDAYPVTEEQVKAFRNNGYLVVRNLCSRDEVAGYRRLIRRASSAHNQETRALKDRDVFGAAFLQTMNLRFISDEISQFVTAPRFASLAAHLLGVESLRIFHEQSLFKEPGGGITPWHQDQYYWPIDSEFTIGMWMPLVDCDEEMGVLRFVEGSHRNARAIDLDISEESQAKIEMLIDANHWPVKCEALNAGDATFHWGWTIHGAGENRSIRMREAMAVSFYADGSRVCLPRNKSQEHDRLHFLGGKIPGEKADDPRNHVVYPSTRTG